MTGQVLLVRPVAGEAGERARVAHLVDVPADAEQPERLKTCCGKEFGPGELELLHGVRGMPCEDCLLRSGGSPGELSPRADPAALITGGSSEAEPTFRPDPAVYLYHELAAHFTRLIEAGRWRANDPLPSERALADEYGVSLGTVRHATRLLAARGLVATLRSKGTFVVPKS